MSFKTFNFQIECEVMARHFKISLKLTFSIWIPFLKNAIKMLVFKITLAYEPV